MLFELLEKLKYESKWEEESFSSAYSLSDNLHSVLESLDALRETVEDLVLLIETLVHFVFEVLTESCKLSHCLPLELLNVFVLLFELAIGIILESAELKCFVSSFVINLLVEVVLAVVDLLHDIFLAFNTRLHLTIELILKT